MDLTVSHEVRRPRSPALRTGVLAVVAALSGAVAGVVVARHRPASVTTSNSGPTEGVASGDVRGIVAAVAPGVVSVRSRPARITDLFASSPPSGAGTGIVIRQDGTILTDAALVTGSRPITVRLGDGRTLAATVVGRDAGVGVAVLKVAAHGLPIERLASETALRVGDDVVGFGDALSLPGGPTVSRGVVAAVQRTVSMPRPRSTTSESVGAVPSRLTGLIQVTTSLGRAAAGGPVVDADGVVVGLATVAADGDRAPGFAIDIARALPAIRAIEDGRAPADALGVDAIDVTPGLARAYSLPVESGAFIASVVPGSPAATAGLQPNDIVVRVGRERVATAQDLTREAQEPSAVSMSLSVRRGTQSLTVTVPLH